LPTPALAPQKATARLKRALAAGSLLGWIARAEGQSRLQLAGYLTARVQVEDPLFGDTFEYDPVLYIVDVDVDGLEQEHPGSSSGRAGGG
jgi:hypothetical protein